METKKDNFSKLVQKCAKNLDNHTIFNASKEHALILFQNLLDVAKRKNEPVRIFSGCYEDDFYKNLTSEIKEILDQGIKIQLLSECKKAKIQNNDFVKIVSDHKHGSFHTANSNKHKIPHFIIVGNSRYRIELDDKLKSARANFNDPTNGSTILKLFATLSPETNNSINA